MKNSWTPAARKAQTDSPPVAAGDACVSDEEAGRRGRGRSARSATCGCAACCESAERLAACGDETTPLAVARAITRAVARACGHRAARARACGLTLRSPSNGFARDRASSKARRSVICAAGDELHTQHGLRGAVPGGWGRLWLCWAICRVRNAGTKASRSVQIKKSWRNTQRYGA
eukprot:1341584-Pleurochrysis_carterae.AAC.1